MRPLIRWFLRTLDQVWTELPSHLPTMELDVNPGAQDEYEVIRRSHDLHGGMLMYGGWQPWDPTNPNPSWDD